MSHASHALPWWSVLCSVWMDVVISVVSSLSHETVEGLKLRVQALTAMPIYHQALSLRGTRSVALVTSQLKPPVGMRL